MDSRAHTPTWRDATTTVPRIRDDEVFSSVVHKLIIYVADTVDVPHTFEEFRVNPAARILAPLTASLADEVHHEGIIAALLVAKGYFDSVATEDDRDLHVARGYACEVVAWRLVLNLSAHEAVDFLCCEIPPEDPRIEDRQQLRAGNIADEASIYVAEETPLLNTQPNPDRSSIMGQGPVLSEAVSYLSITPFDDVNNETIADPHFTSQFENLSALEIAAVVNAKKFLCQSAVQRIIDGIWNGDIIFWETLSIHATKKARIYNKRHTDLYARLRVPLYLKSFEVIFFASFLVLYYIVLVEKSLHRITPAEILLYIWIAGFAYEELGELQDAGQTSFYTIDFWFVWDIGIVAIGFGFLVLRVIGLRFNNAELIDTAFDLLALEALLLCPRICSMLGNVPYFGTLIPCLREMTKDFMKFLSLVIILYLGFLTTFTMLARGSISAKDMSWLLIKVFFGSSYLGFDVASQISKIFGPPIMVVFVILTNILLITSLISLLSNSLTRIMSAGFEEYCFGYSVYVLEASTSNRLTYYLPPLNLIGLAFRPVRLFVSAERLRSARIILLRLTHFPYVAAIWAFEKGYEYVKRDSKGRLANLEGPTNSATMRRGRYRQSLQSPRVLAPSSNVQASMNGNLPSRPQATASGAASTGATSGDIDLQSLVIKLSLQVEQLTVMVADLQGQDGNVSEETGTAVR